MIAGVSIQSEWLSPLALPLIKCSLADRLCRNEFFQCLILSKYGYLQFARTSRPRTTRQPANQQTSQQANKGDTEMRVSDGGHR